MSVNLNDTEKYNANEVKIFNDGQAGVVKNIAITIEKKGPDDNVKSPDYKAYANDDKGKVSEGFYYQDDDAKGFLKYQSQKLIWFARGVMGDDFKFPEFESAKIALDEIMKLVATNTKGKLFNIAVTYGSKKDPQQFLTFKEYGRFLQKVGEDNELELSNSDSIERGKAKDDSSNEKDIQEALKTDSNEDWING